MDASRILSADVLDIIFDARNKEYGAYDLRKHYQRRLMKSLLAMTLIVILLLITYLLVAAITPKEEKLQIAGEIKLAQVEPPQKVEPPPPPSPPPPPPPPAAIKMRDFTAPIIVANPPEDERPPEQAELDNARIGLANIDGKADDNTITPPVDVSKGVVDAPKKQDDREVIFTKVEIESQYPGGISAWAAFVGRNMVVPQDAIDNAISGTVVVQFVVDIDGSVSNVIVVSGPEELRAAAIAVVKKSGKWTAAIQNGNKVKSYKKQPITIKLEEG